MNSKEKRAPSRFTKAPTGIDGVDEITGGGLPRGRTSLVEGGPGSGKALLALQSLVHGARDQHEAAIFDAFEGSTDRLYIAGEAPHSTQPIANLHALCHEPLRERHEIDVVDVLRGPQRALADGVTLTPLLVKLSPSPVRKIVGTLSQCEPVLQALGLPA